MHVLTPILLYRGCGVVMHEHWSKDAQIISTTLTHPINNVNIVNTPQHLQGSLSQKSNPRPPTKKWCPKAIGYAGRDKKNHIFYTNHSRYFLSSSSPIFPTKKLRTTSNLFVITLTGLRSTMQMLTTQWRSKKDRHMYPRENTTLEGLCWTWTVRIPPLHSMEI